MACGCLSMHTRATQEEQDSRAGDTFLGEFTWKHVIEFSRWFLAVVELLLRHKSGIHINITSLSCCSLLRTHFFLRTG